jgi:hypothetical protein
VVDGGCVTGAGAECVVVGAGVGADWVVVGATPPEVEVDAEAVVAVL